MAIEIGGVSHRANLNFRHISNPIFFNKQVWPQFKLLLGIIQKEIMGSLKAEKIKIIGEKNVCVNCDELIDSKVSILKDDLPPHLFEELNYQKLATFKAPSLTELIKFLGSDWVGHWTVVPKAK